MSSAGVLTFDMASGVDPTLPPFNNTIGTVVYVRASEPVHNSNDAHATFGGGSANVTVDWDDVTGKIRTLSINSLKNTMSLGGAFALRYSGSPYSELDLNGGDWKISLAQTQTMSVSSGDTFTLVPTNSAMTIDWGVLNYNSSNSFPSDSFFRSFGAGSVNVGSTVVQSPAISGLLKTKDLGDGSSKIVLQLNHLGIAPLPILSNSATTVSLSVSSEILTYVAVIPTQSIPEAGTFGLVAAFLVGWVAVRRRAD
jgi:hypothetical protein